MADGTISLAYGLGLQALDRNNQRSHTSTTRSSPPKNPHKPFDLCPAVCGELSPNLLQKSSPSRKLQQVFEQALVQEAEEQAIHLRSTTSQIGGYQNQVQVPHPNPKVINPRGNLEGDPNMGYRLEDTRPRYNATGSTSHQPVIDSITDPLTSFPAHKSTTGPSHSQNQGNHIHTHQFNSKKGTGQVKPKPKNWAALLQSQSPSLDMKLDHFPDLQRGKEALVEIDLELTDVGKWNKYLVGHFLDGQMAYPLIVATARNQWKEHFVAVKPDVAGFYLFEFKDEQSKMHVLEGGPYFFSQKYLVLKDWHRMMKPAREQPTKIPAWVKLHDLPLELWNQECLGRIASTIGRPLHVDHATAKTAGQPGLQQTKTTNARICIEVSAQQVLPDEVQVVVEGESVVIPVEYQVLPPMCNTCHVFGHRTSKCARGASISSPPQQPVAQVWTKVGNGKQKVGCEQSETEQLNCTETVTVHASIVPQQSDNPIVSPVPEEEITDPEVELLEVLEGVVSSTPLKFQKQQAANSVDPAEDMDSRTDPSPSDVPRDASVTELNQTENFQKVISRSTQRKMKKLAREQSQSSRSRGRN
ncbi:hypothetical protein RHGRI_030607 [Rhododendron griersonianum]|uniref:DUF4283 domain-containing protein n=1 Tax=Rhododendron griersonianum TaxID=479676 RepID=A0AAV6IAN1_9ERIC|nr:hypothetical protein RHGRI_030607 [Rhododendron griersonianum]